MSMESSGIAEYELFDLLKQETGFRISSKIQIIATN